MSHGLIGLIYMGRNTLEIYFLHYFLLFPLPMAVGEYLGRLSAGHIAFAELLIVGSVATAVSIGSIVFAGILKAIPWASRLMFGK